MSQVYPIQRTMWESLDAILYTKTIALAREIALELGQPIQPLLQIIKEEERSKFVILPDEETATYQCQALVQNGATLLRCRHPVLSSAPRYCRQHLNSHSSLDTSTLIDIRRVIVDKDVYIAVGLDLYTLTGEPCGCIQDNRVIVFDID